MNNIKESLQEFMSSTKCDDSSIYDIAYFFDFDINDYKEYLLAKMRGRAKSIFVKVKEEIASHTQFSSHVKQIKMADINSEKNDSGMNVLFTLNGKEYILIYNLWDMVIYPKEHKDSITLMANFHENSADLNDSIADAIAPYLNIITTDVNTKIAVGDIVIEESLSVIKSIFNALDILYL